MTEHTPQLEDIDRVVHEPVRLRVLSCLFLVESADFLFLMRQLGLTQGNLSSHMARLEAAGYVTVDKSFQNRRPKTMLRMTPAGRTALETYVSRMKELLGELDASSGHESEATRARRRKLEPRTT